MIRKAIKQNARLFVKFFVSFFLTVSLIAVCCVTVSALAAAEPGSDAETQVIAENPGAEPVDSSLMQQLIGIDGSQTLEIILLVTILSVAPSFLVMVTSFTRIIIVFSFLRNAMQTQSIPPNSVLTGLALFLTIFIMWPTFTRINDEAYQPYSQGEISVSEFGERAAVPLKEFMLKNTTKSNMKFFLDLSGASVYEMSSVPEGTPIPEHSETSLLETAGSAGEGAGASGEATPGGAPAAYGRTPVDLEETTQELTSFSDQLGLEAVIPAFILSELTRAFQMGFLLFIPFLVIDIVVSSTLMAMGMMMLPPSMISMPFKIMLFVLVDGWQLLVGTVVNSFNL